MKLQNFSKIILASLMLVFGLVALPGHVPAAENATIDFQIVNKLTGTASMGATPSDTLSYRQQWKITDGVGALKAESIYRATRTLTASANEELDLSGVLTDAFGNTITFTKIKAIMVYAASANTNNVLVGGAAVNAFVNWVGNATDKLTVKPNGMFFLMDPSANGYGVTGGTGDLLRIENSGAGTSVTYDLVLIGETT